MKGIAMLSRNNKCFPLNLCRLLAGRVTINTNESVMLNDKICLNSTIYILGM